MVALLTVLALLGDATEVQAYDQVLLAGGGVLEGIIIERRDGELDIRIRDTGIVHTVPLSDVVEVRERRGPLDVYPARSRAVADGDAPGRVDLARWCARFPELLDEALQEGERALAADPGLLDAYRVLSDVHRELASRGTRDAAAQDRELALYRRAREQGVGDPLLSLREGELLLELTMPASALGPLEAAARDEGLAPAAHLLRGEANRRLALARDGARARWEAAVEAYERVAAEGSGATGEQAARALRGLGEALYALGDAPGAAEAFQAALGQSSGADGATLEAALGAALVAAGSLDEGCERLRGAVAALGDPAQVRLYGVHRVLGLVRLGDLEGARAALEALPPPVGGAQDDPAGPWPALARACLEASAGSPGAAASLLAVKGVGGGVPEILAAQAWWAAGDLDRVEEAGRLAIRAGFPLGEASRFVGLALASAGQDARAVRYLGYAASAPGSGPRDRYAWAVVLGRLGQRPRARSMLEGVLEELRGARAGAEPRELEARALEGLGWLDYGEGAMEAAGGRFREALSVDPASTYAAAALEALQELKELVAWRDAFHRADGDVLKNKWVEDERYGVRARVDGGRVVLEGKQANAPEGVTSIGRTVEAAGLVRFEAVLDLEGAGPARAGILLAGAGGGEARASGAVSLTREPDGRLVLRARPPGGGAAWSAPVVVGTWGGGPHRLALGPGAEPAGTFVAWLDGVPLGRVGAAGLDRTGAFEAVVHGAAPLGAAWRVEVHEVRLLKRIEEGGR